jgi:hypothetical protein
MIFSDLPSPAEAGFAKAFGADRHCQRAETTLSGPLI